MLIAYTFFIFVFQSQATSKLNWLKYDISTVTVSDFTCELEIKSQDYENFILNEYEPKQKQSNQVDMSELSKGMYLKQYLKNKIESMLTRFLMAQNQKKKEQNSQRNTTNIQSLKNLLSLDEQEKYRVRVADI